MNLNPKPLLSAYFNLWWLPVVLAAVPTAGLAVMAFAFEPSTGDYARVIDNAELVFVLGILAGLAGLVAAGIWHLIQRRWGFGIFQLAMAPVVGLGAFICLSVIVISSMFGPSEDHFADELTIPENIEIADPLPEKPEGRSGAEDRSANASPALETSGSIHQGPASFELRNGMQPGIYSSEIWVNPGEPGMIYLKAFEITRGTPLSARRLRESSSERIGWSDDPNKQFFSNREFTIYEGDWHQPYAARFEVWFVPDSGAAEHKLLEKIFRIEGWQR